MLETYLCRYYKRDIKEFLKEFSPNNQLQFYPSLFGFTKELTIYKTVKKATRSPNFQYIIMTKFWSQQINCQI